MSELSAVKLPALCLAVALGYAPMQCAGDPDPNLRRAETPGEALYGLAQQFEAKGDKQAWKTTLEYLIERYPNSRHAQMARDDLEKDKEKQ